jgi:hypothetical protein
MMKSKVRKRRKKQGSTQQWCLIAGTVALAGLSCVWVWFGLKLPDPADAARLTSTPTSQLSVQTIGRQGGAPVKEPVAPALPTSPLPYVDASVSSTAELPVQGPAPSQIPLHATDATELPVSTHDMIECTDTLDPAPVALVSEPDERVAELLRAVGLTSHLDEPTWREHLSGRFAKALVPVSNHGFGAGEALFFEADILGDNLSLASVFYEVIQVTSAEGQVLEACVGPREPMVGQRIRVPVAKGTSAEEAVIRFEVSVPGDLDAMVLDVGAGHEVTGEMGTGTVAMTRVSDQAVRVAYREMSVPAVYAFDRLGNVLRRERISREPDGVHMVFGGSVETCLVVGVRHMIDHAFVTRVTLNPGQAVALSYEPEVPRYTRFDPMPLVQYEPLLSLDVNDLTVQWRQERRQNYFRQILSVDFPANVAVQSNWEVYAHQNDHKVRLNGSSVVDNQRVVYRCHGAKAVDQMSGSLWFNMYGQIKRVNLSQQDLVDMCCVAMPRGKYLDVHLDKNKLSYRVLGGEVIQLAAFDAQGRRLRQDPTWRTEQGMKSLYFWGVPANVVLDISTQTKAARLDFNLTEPLCESGPLYTTSVRVPF